VADPPRAAPQPSLARRVRNIAIVLIGTGGLRFDRSLPQVVTTVGLVAVTMALQQLALDAGYTVACAVAAGIFYYGGNSLLCSERVSSALRARFGERRSVWLYEVYLGAAFSNHGLALAGVAVATPGTLELPTAVVVALFVALGVLGVVTKYWATFLTGLDVYFYRDLFTRRPVGDLVTRGPYRLLRNPMYGVGNLHAYVPALIVGSGFGLLVAAVYHVAIFTFLVFVERPFVKSLLKQPA
jgi:protein-S-isoprenylcysteine O-methyltransferase Ste14